MGGAEQSTEKAHIRMTLADALRDAVRVNRERPEWTKRRMPTLHEGWQREYDHLPEPADVVTPPAKGDSDDA